MYPVSASTLTDIIMQESKWNALQMELIRGTILRSDQTATEARISLNLLQIINGIDSRKLYKNKQPKATNNTGKNPPRASSAKANPKFVAGVDFHNNAISKVESNKRDAFIYFDKASQQYKLTIKEFPDYLKAYLYLAYALKAMYLLNYNGSKNENMLQEIKTCIEDGIKVDADKIYPTDFKRVIDDIYRHDDTKMQASNLLKCSGIAFLLSLILDNVTTSYLGTYFILLLISVICFFKGIIRFYSARKYIVSK